MADATIKPDSGNDLVLQNNGGSKKIEITNSGNIEVTGAVDLQGNELILDADGDSSITADTDDQVDVKIAGTDKFSVDANGIRLGPKAGSSTSHNVPYKITVGPYNWSQSNDEICEITMGASSTGSDDGEIKFYTAQNVDSGGTLTERFHIENGGNVKVKTGNLVIGTANKGIDFSNDTNPETFGTYSASNSLLADYETGSFSPQFYTSTNITGTPTHTYGYYTKIGNLVYCEGLWTATIASTNADTYIFWYVPFRMQQNYSAVTGVVRHTLNTGYHDTTTIIDAYSAQSTASLNTGIVYFAIDNSEVNYTGSKTFTYSLTYQSQS